MGLRIAINGFGRIGRCLLRALLESKHQTGLNLVAVNSTSPPRTLAHLLKHDSTYGTLPFQVSWEPEGLVIDGDAVGCMNAQDPLKIDWKAFDVSLVLECTGKATHRDAAEKHLTSGADRVIVSAPCRGADITLIPGCNVDSYDPQKHRVVSMGSCTTNCLAPTLRVLHDRFVVRTGFATTVHAYTNDQRLLDGSHEDLRRARAAGQSLIPTTTGAGQVIDEVFPSLKGRIDCLAIRAPTSSVSLLDLVVETESKVDRKSVNQAFDVASIGEMQGIVAISDEPLVSADYRKDPHSAIIDGLSTSTNGPMVRVLAWYDNEWAYSVRLLELAEMIARASVSAGRGLKVEQRMASSHGDA